MPTAKATALSQTGQMRNNSQHSTHLLNGNPTDTTMRIQSVNSTSAAAASAVAVTAAAPILLQTEVTSKVDGDDVNIDRVLCQV